VTTVQEREKGGKGPQHRLRSTLESNGGAAALRDEDIDTSATAETANRSMKRAYAPDGYV
jgi:hypothetical protein